MTYSQRLEATKNEYPFARWRDNFFPDKNDPDSRGMEQYTQENCDKAKAVFDKLIGDLIAAGEQATELQKYHLFEIAVLSLNELDEEVPGLIETGEREDLCELIDKITIAAGLNPEKYSHGEGIAEQWRNW